jgi:hypothetical protein
VSPGTSADFQKIDPAPVFERDDATAGAAAGRLKAVNLWEYKLGHGEARLTEIVQI